MAMYFSVCVCVCVCVHFQALHVYKIWNETCTPFSVLCDRANMLRKQGSLKKAHEDIITLSAHVGHKPRLLRSVYWQVYGSLMVEVEDDSIKAEEMLPNEVSSGELPRSSECFEKALSCLMDFWGRAVTCCKVEERNGGNLAEFRDAGNMQKLVVLLRENKNKPKSQALLGLLEQGCGCLISMALGSANGLARTTSVNAANFEDDCSIAVRLLCSFADVYGGSESEIADQRLPRALVSCITSIKYNGWLIAELLGTYVQLLIKRFVSTKGASDNIRWPQKAVVSKHKSRADNTRDKHRFDSMIEVRDVGYISCRFPSLTHRPLLFSPRLLVSLLTGSVQASTPPRKGKPG